MARDHYRFVGQGHERIAERRRNLLRMEPPGRSVRPIDPAKRVSPAISFFSAWEVEADAALGVAGSVQDAGR